MPPQIYEKNCYAAQVDLDSDGHTDARNRILVTCLSAFPNPSNDNTILAHSTCPKTIDSIISGPNNNMSLGKAIVVSELVANSGRGAVTSQDVLTQQVLGGEWCSTYFGWIMMTRSEILSVRPSNFCSHFMGHKCHIIEAIFCNFGLGQNSLTYSSAYP